MVIMGARTRIPHDLVTESSSVHCKDLVETGSKEYSGRPNVDAGKDISSHSRCLNDPVPDWCVSSFRSFKGTSAMNLSRSWVTLQCGTPWTGTVLNIAHVLWPKVTDAEKTNRAAFQECCSRFENSCAFTSIALPAAYRRWATPRIVTRLISALANCVQSHHNLKC